MRITKKVISVILAVMMVITVLSVGAVSVSAAGPVAQIGNTTYNTLLAAFQASRTGDTIKVIADNTTEKLNLTYSDARTSVTLDLNGHTVSYEYGWGHHNYITIPTFTIMDSSNGNGYFKSELAGSQFFDNSNVENGTIIVKGGNIECGTWPIQTQHFVMTGGKIKSETQDAVVLYSNCSADISGGQIEAGNCGIYTSQASSNIVVSGGSIKAKTPVFFMANNTLYTSKFTMTGGIVESTNASSNDNCAVCFQHSVSKNNIVFEGGRVFAENIVCQYSNPVNNNAVYKGGEFTIPVTPASGYQCVEHASSDGKTQYIVIPNGAGLITNAAELEAACAAGGNYILAEDINDTAHRAESYDDRFAYFVNVSSDFTLNGNGHTVTLGGRGFGVSGSNVNVTFKNITITNPQNGGRAIDTRGGGLSSLTLDHAIVEATGGHDNSTGNYAQGLTVGGNQTKVMDLNIINGSEVRAPIYYAIITFNPVNATITDSTLDGWACIYAKGPSSSAGSDGSVYNISGCTLLSSNIAPAGQSNSFSMIKIENTSDVSVNISDCDITVSSNSSNEQCLFGAEIFTLYGTQSAPTVDNVINMGEGNVVELVGEKAEIASVESGCEMDVEITGGTFSDDKAYKYIADGAFVTKNADGSVAVSENIPVIKTTVNASAFGLGSKDITNYEILGYQKNIKDGSAVRFVTAVNEGFLKGANIADYGYVLAKASGLNMQDNGDKLDALKYNGGNGEHTVSCKESSNTLSGNYGKYSPSTPYKFVTAAVTNMSGSDQAVARFYIKTTDGNVYYANYDNGTSYDGLLAELS